MARSSDQVSTWRQSWTDTWWPEILTSAFSFVCLAALYIVLIYANGAPIQVWKGLTLNTLVSILAAASKASALLSLSSSISQWRWCIFKTERRRLIDFETIDQASRGPSGCLRLIWRTKGASLVCIGGITVIAAIAFEPFAQQVVQYESNSVCKQSTRVSTPRAERFSGGNGFAQQLAALQQQHVWTALDFSMQSAILYGLNEPTEKVTQQLSYQCPSDNCTWVDPYNSLAVCSKCEDLTRDMTKSHVRSQLASDLQYDNGGGTANPGTRFTLPNTLYIEGEDGWKYVSGNDSWMYRPNYDAVILGGVFMTSLGTSDPSLTNKMKDVDTLIWSNTMIRIKPDITSSDHLFWPNIPLQADECALYYCVNSYNSKVTNATLVETVEEQKSIQRNPASWQLSASDVKYNNLTSSQIQSIAFQNKLSSLVRTDLQLGDSYNLSQSAVDSISAYMQKTFTETPLVSPINGWYIDDGQRQYFPAVMQLLHPSPDLTNMFQNVATSMSNALRAGGDNALRVDGKLCQQATTYRIAWPWLALPVCVIIAGLTQLVLSMIRSARSNTPLWKSSSLAVLSRGHIVPEKFRDLKTLSAMEDTAKSSSVKLFSGWQRSSNPLSPISQTTTWRSYSSANDPIIPTYTMPLR